MYSDAMRTSKQDDGKEGSTTMREEGEIKYSRVGIKKQEHAQKTYFHLASTLPLKIKMHIEWEDAWDIRVGFFPFGLFSFDNHSPTRRLEALKNLLLHLSMWFKSDALDFVYNHMLVLYGGFFGYSWCN